MPSHIVAENIFSTAAGFVYRAQSSYASLIDDFLEKAASFVNATKLNMTGSSINPYFYDNAHCGGWGILLKVQLWVGSIYSPGYTEDINRITNAGDEACDDLANKNGLQGAILYGAFLGALLCLFVLIALIKCHLNRSADSSNAGCCPSRFFSSSRTVSNSSLHVPLTSVAPAPSSTV